MDPVERTAEPPGFKTDVKNGLVLLSLARRKRDIGAALDGATGCEVDRARKRAVSCRIGSEIGYHCKITGVVDVT